MYLTRLTILLYLTISMPSHAALFDRGNGLIYDDVLDITWLQGANYAATQYVESGGSIGDVDGVMTWYEANNWAGSLIYAGFDDWRIPSAGNAVLSQTVYRRK